MKRVAIVQSNYIPWKGYFDLIGSVDEFIFYDDVQYTRRDWRNRNKIKTAGGLQWLTVPVSAKGRYHQTIRETALDGDRWVEKHLRSISQGYAQTPHFEEVSALLSPVYRRGHTLLWKLNHELIAAVCGYLGIRTLLTDCQDYRPEGNPSERLASLCRQAGADEYVSGPAARTYLDEGVFRALGIGVRWFDYSGYPEYPQQWGPFEHHVSVIDLLFNCGPGSARWLERGPAGIRRTEESG